MINNKFVKQINKISVILDIITITFLLSIIAWGTIVNGDKILGVVFFVSIGLFSLISKKMKDFLLFSGGLYWVLHNIFKPRTKNNHLIWGFFFIFIGFIIYLADPMKPSDKMFFNEMKKHFVFWIALVAILIFNLFVGLFTKYYNDKKTVGR